MYKQAIKLGVATNNTEAAQLIADYMKVSVSEVDASLGVNICFAPSCDETGEPFMVSVSGTPYFDEFSSTDDGTIYITVDLGGDVA